MEKKENCDRKLKEDKYYFNKVCWYRIPLGLNFCSLMTLLSFCEGRTPFIQEFYLLLSGI